MRLICFLMLLALSSAADQAAAQDCGTAAECQDAVLLESFLEQFQLAMTAENYVEAEVLAKRIITLANNVNGRESVSSANALLNLGMVQSKLDQLVPARQNVLAALQILEAVNGRLSPHLVPALNRLGAIQLALDDPDQSRAAFEQAVHIQQVTSGPRSLEQIESLNGVTEAYYSAGDIRGALKTQLNVYALQARQADTEGLEFVAALEHYAAWMHKLGLPNRKRNAYRAILNIQEAHGAKNDPSTIPTLIKLGHSFEDVEFSHLDDDYLPLSGAPYFYWRRAQKIASEHPESNWRLAAETSLITGDFYLKAHRFGLCPKADCESFLSRRRVMKFVRARYAYEDAWNDFSKTPEGAAIRDQLMTEPARLSDVDLPIFYEDEMPLFEQEEVTEDFRRGTITAEFDVSKLSKIVNIAVVDANPHGMKKIEKRLVNEVKNLVYRPRMQEGTLVDTRGLTYTYEFFYRCREETQQSHCT